MWLHSDMAWCGHMGPGLTTTTNKQTKRGCYDHRIHIHNTPAMALLTHQLHRSFPCNQVDRSNRWVPGSIPLQQLFSWTDRFTLQANCMYCGILHITHSILQQVCTQCSWWRCPCNPHCRQWTPHCHRCSVPDHCLYPHILCCSPVHSRYLHIGL